MRRITQTFMLTAGLAFPANASVTIDWVSVGDSGNAADTTGYGAVTYDYQIGKYEVTNAQYAAFLNAAAQTDSYGLYHKDMALHGITRSGYSGTHTYSVTAGLENHPVVYVSWFDAARMANWMTNGQGDGDTETGAYTLNGATSGIITANEGAQIHIPTEDEWYKAAYYQGDASYSLYPNGEDTITTADANYEQGVGTLSVGFYSSDPSAYGTFDQGGNVWEWNDASVFGAARGLRGGSWDDLDDSLASSGRSIGGPSDESDTIGFRLASTSVSAVPEPGSLLGLAGLLGGGLAMRRRKD